MKHIIIQSFFTLALMAVLMPLTAQVVVEEVITTDTVDIFAAVEKQQQLHKSPRVAMLGSLVLPGLGHQYLGNDKRAFGYYLTEAMLVFGLVYSERYSRKMYSNSRSYAWRYAATHSDLDPQNEYWKIIGNKYFMTLEEFNNAMELNGIYDEKIVDEQKSWHWETEAYQKEYRDIRKVATRFHIVSSFFMGGMILNHVVAFIDTRIASKYLNIQGKHTSLQIYPQLSIAEENVGISMIKKF